MILQLGKTQHKGRKLRHVHALHSAALTHDSKLIEDSAEETHVLLQVRTEIVGVPPQVVHPAALSGIGHVGQYAPLL